MAKSGRGTLARQELTCVSYVIMPDGRTVLADDLTPEEYAHWQENLRRRMGQALNEYYSLHPEEYARLSDPCSNVRDG